MGGFLLAVIPLRNTMLYRSATTLRVMSSIPYLQSNFKPPMDDNFSLQWTKGGGFLFPAEVNLFTKENVQKLEFYPVVGTPTQSNADTIRVISYNILAESLALRHHSLYSHTYPQDLSWDNRIKRLIPQLQELNADFYCLQEVDNFSRLENDLGYIGYKGCFKKRTSAKNQDGCAVFWRTERFEHLHSVPIEFNQYYDDTQDFDNVALCSFFKVKSNSKEILCVVSTHLLFNPQRGDLKLGQAQFLLSKIQKSIEHARNNNPDCNISMILAGDMNSTPYSGIYELLKRGKLELKLGDLPLWCHSISGQQIRSRRQQEIEISKCIESLAKLGVVYQEDETTLSFSHDFDLSSAYENYSSLHEQLFNQSIESPPSPIFHNDTYGEPRVTAMTGESTNAVDSIWFTKNSMKLLKLLALPQQNKLIGSPARIPSPVHPSDHFILGAEFQLKE